MVIENIPQIGSEILHKQVERVTDIQSEEVQQVVEDLIDTMRAENLVGMAAPQIGRDMSIFITELRETKIRTSEIKSEPIGLRVFINPEVLELRGEIQVMREGCGSICRGALFADVPRPNEVELRYTDTKGSEHVEVFTDFMGRVVQHEYDHLHGILFTERVVDNSTFIHRDVLREQNKINI